MFIDFQRYNATQENAPRLRSRGWVAAFRASPRERSRGAFTQSRGVYAVAGRLRYIVIPMLVNDNCVVTGRPAAIAVEWETDDVCRQCIKK